MKKDEETWKTTSYKLPVTLWTRLREQAARQGRFERDVLIDAATMYLDAMNPKKKVAAKREAAS